jgi:VWFA-related protein
VNGRNQYIPDPRYDVPAAQALNDANIAIYAVDLFDAQALSPLQDAMSNFAQLTGGRYYQHQVNFITPLRQIAEETSGYYLLAYKATHPQGAKGYQRVKVTLANPELRVKAREGYTYGD